jgi:hypothetical protein
MTVISSQKYIDWSKVEEKKEALEKSNATKVTLKTWNVNIDDLQILFDGHHTRQAAIELGLEIEYEIIDHPEGLTGDNLLEQAWLDSDWYNVETEQLVF